MQQWTYVLYVGGYIKRKENKTTDLQWFKYAHIYRKMQKMSLCNKLTDIIW